MPIFDVTIVGKAYLPDVGLPLPPAGSGGVPTHPIYYPPGIWGGGGVGNYPDAGLPGPQPGGPVRPWGPINYPDQGLPGKQPGLWPIRPPYVDIGFPGPQPGPSHPIVVPPGIWGGSGEPFPTPPIYIPIPPPGSEAPSQPINEPPTDSPYWMQVFLPNVGWVWAIIPKPPSGGGGEGSSGSP
jgi:hypothetical protein